MLKFDAEEFYPTPEKLRCKMTAGIDWRRIQTVLEPSAGKGDIADHVISAHKSATYGSDLDIDCVEKDVDLRSTLKGKNHKVVHDDFLTFHTFKKYDLIIMNPPFSNGASHLLKALEMQKDGGAVVCILNAETLRNPYTNERKVLVQKLNQLNADIQYMQGEFATAENPTGVEIALIKVCIEAVERESYIFEELKKKTYSEGSYQGNITDVAPKDFIEAIVAMYNIEVESGVRLIQEYKAMCPHIMNDIRENISYNSPILQMKVNGKDLSTNRFVREVRKKYWSALFKNPKFTGNMTSNLIEEYNRKVHELANYDFSVYNIKCIQVEMSKHLIKGIEDCIIKLFDDLSFQYSYNDELSNNIHYYNGWKTNKAWFINKKVIIPWMNAFSSWNGKFDPSYDVKRKLMDIEKALNYLDGGLTESRDMEMWLHHAAETGQTKNIRLKYFTVTFYKKGTCHLVFENEELLKKLNIFGSQQKGWLPPGYGKRTYDQMDESEKQIVDSFEGKEAYEAVMANTGYFIYEPKNVMPALETNDDVA